MTARMPDGRPLVGPILRLDPATANDADELFTLLDDERIWAADYSGGPANKPTSPAQCAERIPDRAERIQYVARLIADSPLGGAGTVVGTSSLGDFSLVDERAHLGWTAYAPAVWGTAVNPACKLLLLGHCFDDCGFGRVKIQTDTINTRSQAAIAKLGAQREGVLRRHMAKPDGSWRDTVVFSVLVDEWPRVADGLRARIAAD
ncbi:MAG: GNAT family N-acetyltransferase [Actinomycetota bacterium]|nr:GNAT family N-acetyltransferase [Actinomycetota bacterium]